MNSRKKQLIAVVALSVLAAAVIYGGWYFFSLPRQFAVVDAGILYRSGLEKGNQYQNAIDQYGIKTIICLREVRPDRDTRWFDRQKATAERNNVNFIHWPTNSNDPVPEEKWIEFLKLTQNPEYQPILVHCAMGKHRTGFFVSVYRMIINDWSFGQTIVEMDQFDYGLDTHVALMDTLRFIDPQAVRQEHQLTTRPTAENRSRFGILADINLWVVLGFTGQFVFFSRFMIQWIASERRGQTHVPVIFWYLSLIGGLIIMVYAIGRNDIVISLGQGLGCLIYIRNLMIVKNHRLKLAEIEENAA